MLLGDLVRHREAQTNAACFTNAYKRLKERYTNGLCDSRAVINNEKADVVLVLRQGKLNRGRTRSLCLAAWQAFRSKL